MESKGEKVIGELGSPVKKGRGDGSVDSAVAGLSKDELTNLDKKLDSRLKGNKEHLDHVDSVINSHK